MMAAIYQPLRFLMPTTILVVELQVGVGVCSMNQLEWEPVIISMMEKSLSWMIFERISPFVVPLSRGPRRPPQKIYWFCTYPPPTHILAPSSPSRNMHAYINTYHSYTMTEPRQRMASFVVVVLLLQALRVLQMHFTPKSRLQDTSCSPVSVPSFIFNSVLHSLPKFFSFFTTTTYFFTISYLFTTLRLNQNKHSNIETTPLQHALIYFSCMKLYSNTPKGVVPLPATFNTLTIKPRWSYYQE
jgi:hypothetical protein